MVPTIELLKIDFRDFCVDKLYKRHIDDIFSAAGIEKGKSKKETSKSERRVLVEDYYASLNWESIESIHKFQKVLENTLMFDFSHRSDREDAKEELRNLYEKHRIIIDKDGHKIHFTTSGVGNTVKNLIFAANGLKPEIIFSDSISNDIEIVKNAEYCLIYDCPIMSHGLLWKEFIAWWRKREQLIQESDETVAQKLYKRLVESLSSEPEKLFFKAYFKFYNTIEKLPALIPQVYLHYDPYTIKQLQNQRRLARQRMDFLLLLSDRVRVVIEIDGKQHYAEGDIACPRLYSEMVAEDRRLKLAGYELYRFGGYELAHSNAEEIVKNFFHDLFKRHNIIADESQ